MRTVLLISSLVQFSPRDMNTDLGVSVNAGPLTHPPTLNLLQNNLLFVLIATGFLDGLEISRGNNVHQGD